jgi:hypothetical protein
MGKSWLLTETARCLTVSADPPLVGYTECMGESADQFLRATVDLYTRWLTNSSWTEQAQVVWAQQSKDLVGRTGEAVGSIFHSLSKAVGFEPIGSIVEGSFKTLASMNRDLTSSGITVPRLLSEQALEVLSLIHKISGKPIVMLFDQWEKSPALVLESNVLDVFLRHIDEWPPCHFIIGTRPDDQPLKLIKELDSHSQGALESYELLPMHLSAGERDRVIRCLHTHLPITQKSTDASLLQMLSGYPGTLSRWLSPYNKSKTLTLDGLTQLSTDAQAYRFREFDELMPALSDAEITVAMLLALVPSSADDREWMVIRTVILKGLSSKLLDELKTRRILEQVRPPRFGHSKRAEAALRWFEEHRSESLREECESLVVRLASLINSTENELLPFINCLRALSVTSLRLGLDDSYLVLCDIAKSLQGKLGVINSRKLLKVSITIQDLPFGEQVASLLSMGLVNACIHAHGKKLLELRNQLFLQLTRLLQVFPNDQGVRLRVSMGLFNMVVHAKDHKELELRDAALYDLRHLSQAFPNDAGIRSFLSMGLNDAITYSKREGVRERGYELLSELRDLANHHPSETCIHEELARSLKSVIIHTYGEQEFEQQDENLEELWSLATRNPNNLYMRNTLAERLRFAGDDSERGEHLDMERQFRLTMKLFEFAELHSHDPSVLENLSKALWSYFCVIDEPEYEEQKLAALAQARRSVVLFPDDSNLRVNFAEILWKIAEKEKDCKKRDSLNRELLDLSKQYPDDLGMFRQGVVSGLADNSTG